MEPATPTNPCTPPRRKRQTWTPASVTNVYSVKRRRISSVSADLATELITEQSISKGLSELAGDRFIAARPRVHVPLNITPRTQRIARGLGLIEDRILNFKDPGSASTSISTRTWEHHALRSNYSRLLAKPQQVSVSSAATNLGTKKQFLLALDGPGMPGDPFAYPLAWSRQNVIAVACGKDIYTQDLDTRAITRICKIEPPSHGRPMNITWSTTASETLAVGTTTGSLQLWDADTKKCTRTWREPGWDSIGGVDWRGAQSMFAAGSESGLVTFWDPRQAQVAGKLTRHRRKVNGLKWSQDGNYLASGDQDGVVFVWDARAGKVLSDDSRMGGRLKHNAPVKAFAWCPWQPDLLATGSTFPDGKIRIFSVKNNSAVPKPQHVLSLNTAVTSLQWSPHCKELLSTHGTSWHPKGGTVVNGRPVPVPSPLMNSITVHTYPSYRRVLSVPAHMGAVTQSCLSPDGTLIFTICPAEEAMKMWKVWELPKREPKSKTLFDQYSIR
ncbi:hypothetical protein EIP86_006242 [Pleurotus ostreatoroseus]|nr:hypothetical protein EIP86_006242 [Pleurotus ostreatoroseus]